MTTTSLARTDLATHAAQVEAVFVHIAETRMAGVPVLNGALGVALRGFQDMAGDRVGVLVTPWFMNLICFPPDGRSAVRRVGTQAGRRLPSGVYDAVWNHEDALGGYWSISLFSPMHQFADMDAAVATADATLALMLAADADEDEDDAVRDAAREVSVLPAAPVDVEARLALADHQAAADAAKQAEEDSERAAPALDRRALLGLRGRADAA